MIDLMLRKVSDHTRKQAGVDQYPDDAIDELNTRFNQHAIGYRYESGSIIQVDSEYVHSEAVKPALMLLHANGFDGASDEFIRAHEHYRKGRTKEAIAEALKAFESTMKSICAARNWAYPSGATAKTLLDILLRQRADPDGTHEPL